MAKERIDVIELLCKRGIDGDMDFLREALTVVVDGILDAEVSTQIGAEYGERTSTASLIAMVTAPVLGTPG